MNEADMLRTLTEAEAKGQRVTGVYHSHANAGS
jgi:proteasome lid subunit RPN8/RPN11